MAGRAMTILIGPLGYFCISALAIGVLREMSFALFSGLALLGDAIMANVKNHAPKP